jgi:hypothetical protein
MTAHREALYYPFHLCSERMLVDLLRTFQAVHFRDYMALQLTPFFGTTAFQDRMGDAFPDLVAAGRLVQGYRTSGPLDAAMEEAVDRDLADPVWRDQFHRALEENRRFQRGLFDPSHGMVIGGHLVPGPAALLQLMEPSHAGRPFTVESVRKRSRGQHALRDAYEFEYGLALVKTALSGMWTVRIARQHDLCGVTDSTAHYHLLEQTCRRDGIPFAHQLLPKIPVTLTGT